MTPEEWRRAKGFLEVALTRPPAERLEYIAEICGDDTALRQELESLLAASDDRVDLADLLPTSRAANHLPAASSATASVEHTRMAAAPDATGWPPQGVRATTPPTPSTWGDFVLLDEIGRGGYGVVHRAWDATLEREVALKVIDVGRIRGGSVAKVLREGQMLARIRHQNVVVVYSAQRLGGEVGLAMEYIKGRTLSSLLARNGPLSAPETVPIGLALCDAMTAVHNGGLVHRDVKASNVMREGGGRIVLMDFGAGRELLRETATWSDMVGTPMYMAPEVLRGERATAASDVYSLGVLLFYLVTGRYPLSSTRVDDIVRAHADGRRQLLSECRADLPTAFVAAVERTLEADMNLRPASAAVLKRELSRALSQMPHRRRDSHRLRSESSRLPAAVEIRAVHAPAAERPELRALHAILLCAGVLVLLSAFLGFVTTLEFNVVLGRYGGFASESALDYVIWGIRSLIAPAAYAGMMLLLFNGVMLTVRVATAAMPSLGTRVQRVRAACAAGFARVGLNDATTLARALSWVGFAVVLLIVWAFRSLMVAFASPIDDAPAASLAMLSTEHREIQSLYRRLLELDLLFLTLGLAAVVRTGRANGAPLSPSALTGVLSVAGIVLLLLAGPWRLVFDSTFREARLGQQACFILGEHDGEMLLHCPAARPRRNRVIAKADPQLVVTESMADLFDAYSSAAPIEPSR